MAKVITLLLTIALSRIMYLTVSRRNDLLKPINTQFSSVFFLGFPCAFFSMMAQRAGVRVNATTPERMMEVAIVIENCR